jgi:hexosaminidase
MAKKIPLYTTFLLCFAVILPAFFTAVSAYELNSISLCTDRAVHYGKDGYRLDIKDDSVLISAASSLGVFYGVQTLRQLFPAEIESQTRVDGIDWTLPGVSIIDSARFEWRGVMIDCGRHYFSSDAIKRQIDLMSCYKLNRFHWHLSDDQGWRIEILSYPELAGPNFYTQKEVREILEYASLRGVTVIPEIEMPGHCVAALRKFPELSCTGGPIPEPNDGGVHEDVFCAGNDSVFVFLQNVLSEIAELFPSALIHIGGDEVPATRWSQCPKCIARMEAESLDGTHELNKWFVDRIAAFLKTKNRNIEGWDEIVDRGAPDSAIIQVWRSPETGLEAAEAGHYAVMSPINDMYSWNNNHEWLPLGRMYSYDPVPNGMKPEFEKFILGAEHCIWTEGIENQERLDWHAWGRNCALAEVDWTPASLKDFQFFSTALSRHYVRLGMRGVNSYIDPQIPADTSVSRYLLIPRPVSISPMSDSFRLAETTIIKVSDSTLFAGEYFASVVYASAGMTLEIDNCLPAQAEQRWPKTGFLPGIQIRCSENKLVVFLQGGMEISEVRLYNQMGRTAGSGYASGKGEIFVPLKKAVPGVYILACRVDGRRISAQVVLTH